MFKQHYTYFHTLFHPRLFLKNTNNVTRITLPNTPPKYLKNCSYCLFFILFFGVVLTLGLNRNEAEKPSPPSQALVQPPVVATTPACARPRWRVSLKMMVCAVCVAQSFGCSLSWSRKVDLPSALWQESRLNFKGLPKLSGVITNHWVFLRCDWSPVFSWFYYQS